MMRKIKNIISIITIIISPVLIMAQSEVSIATNNSNILMAATNTIDVSVDDAKRLKFHMLIHSSQMHDAIKIYEGVALVDVPVDVRVHLSLARYNIYKDKKAAMQFRNLVRNGTSPSVIYMKLESFSRNTKGDMYLSGWQAVLDQEPFWIPALYSKVKSTKGSWLTAAKYGSTALDIIEKGAPVAEKIMLSFPQHKVRVNITNSTLYADVVLGQFSRYAARPDWMWSEKHPEEEKWLKAALLYQAGHYKQAITLYENIIASSVYRPGAYVRLAKLYDLDSNHNKAIIIIQRGLNRYSEKNSALLVVAADYAIKKGDIKEALRLLTQCIKASPEYPPAHIMLAEINAKKGNKDAAIKACANTAAYCYGWGKEYLDKINMIINNL